MPEKAFSFWFSVHDKDWPECAMYSGFGESGCCPGSVGYSTSTTGSALHSRNSHRHVLSLIAYFATKTISIDNPSSSFVGEHDQRYPKMQ